MVIIIQQILKAKNSLSSITVVRNARYYSTTKVCKLASVGNMTSRPLSAAALYADGRIRNDWTKNDIRSIFDSPIMDLLFYGVSNHSFIICMSSINGQ